MDIVFLLTVLPKNISLVCKKSLLRIPFLKTFIKKLDCIAIEKYDASQAINDIQLIKKRLINNESVLLFPEGTFGFAKGLRPFKLGAFKLATELQIPICPITIKGTRDLLKGNSLLFRWHPLEVIIAEPITPAGTEWKDMISLKNSAYSVILKQCGEPRLDFVIVNQSASKKAVNPTVDIS